MDERERQYREYLALREHNRQSETEESDGFSRNDAKYGRYFANNSKERRKLSITDTPYGSSELRRKQQEKQRRDREMQEYLAAREGGGSAGGRLGRSGRSGRSIARNKAYEKTSRKTGGKIPGKMKGRNRRLKGIVAVLTLLVGGTVVAGIAALVMALGALGSMEHLDIDKDAIGINPSVASQLEGYTNIAVLGIDARADEDDSNARSDAIVVASINNETDEVKMFSVFRDTMLDVGDQGLDKITHAYFYGGTQQSLYALNSNMDLNIDKAVVINWKTVADIIDSVGGIEIDLQESEIDEMNKYIPETARNVDGPDTPVESAGKQTLNGVQAVTYSRIRKDAVTGDYRRNERMKIVFKETFKELKSSGFLTMFKVMRKAMPEVKTNISSADILGMMIKFKSYDMTDSTTGWPYDVGSWTGNAGAGYAWYGPPVNLANNVSKLHEQFFDQPAYQPTDTVQQISNEISYRTGIY